MMTEIERHGMQASFQRSCRVVMTCLDAYIHEAEEKLRVSRYSRTGYDTFWRLQVRTFASELLPDLSLAAFGRIEHHVPGFLAEPIVRESLLCANDTRVPLISRLLGESNDLLTQRKKSALEAVQSAFASRLIADPALLSAVGGGHISSEHIRETQEVILAHEECLGILKNYKLTLGIAAENVCVVPEAYLDMVDFAAELVKPAIAIREGDDRISLLEFLFAERAVSVMDEFRQRSVLLLKEWVIL